MTKPDDKLMEHLIRCSIPEENIVNPLLASSAEFKSFYDSERGKIKSQLIWVNAEKFYGKGNVPAGHLAEFKEFPNGVKAIIITKYPVDENDASTIAHELAHVVFKEEKFPFIGHYTDCDDSDVMNLCGYLGEMIHEPLVIKKLLQFGFDLRQEYIDECVEIRKNGKMEFSGIKNIMATFMFVQFLLEQDLLFTDKNNPCCEVIRELGTQHPYTMTKAIKIYEYINQNGLNSPQQVNGVIKKVLEMYPALSGLFQVY